MTSAATRSLATLTASVLVIVAAACGDSDSSDEPAGAAKPAVHDPAADKREIVALFNDIYRGMTENEPAVVCGRMSRKARVEAASFALDNPRASCTRTISTLARRSREAGEHPKRPRVLRVRTHRDGAVAILAALDGGEAKASLVREDGRWKLWSMFDAQ